MIFRRLGASVALLGGKLESPNLTKSGIFVELHRSHIEPLLEVARKEKNEHQAIAARHRNEDGGSQYRADLFREIEFRLNQASLTLHKESQC